MIQNLVDARARPAQDALLTIARDGSANGRWRDARKLVVPVHHDVRAEDVDLKRLGAVLAVAYEPRVARLRVAAAARETRTAHAAIAGAHRRGRFTARRRASPIPRASRLRMAARTGTPFPVPLKTYDESIAVLRRSLDAAKLGDTEKIDGMKRLDKFVRAIERRYSPEADFDAVDGSRARDLAVARRPHRVRPFDSR